MQLNGSNYRIGMMLGQAHLSPVQIEDTIDQCYMRIGLWVVTQSSWTICANLFREQAKMTSITQQTIKERPRLGNTSLHRKVIYQPECTDGKGPFIARQSIVSKVPIDEPMFISHALHNAINC